MLRIAVPAVVGRSSRIGLGLVAGVSLLFVSVTTVFAQQPPAQPAAPAQQAQSAVSTRTFSSDAGMVLNFIKPDQTAAFEAVMAKLKEALQKSDKPQRKEQAKGWKIFKSADPAGANALYVFVIDPAVKGADYSVANILAEAFPPDQVNDLYKQYAGAYAQGQNIINLNLVIDLSK